MAYRELPPSADLAPWLACLWEREDDGAQPVRVVPDGCIDVVWTEGVGAQLVGANTTAFLVELAPGARVAGARLRPGAAPALLGVDAEAALDARTPLAEVWGDAGARLAWRLDASRGATRILAAAMTERAAAAPAPDPLVQAAVRRIAAPGTSMTAVARELAVSERQLRRRVTGAVGYGPKRLARVLRLQRALEAAWSGEELARVAFDAGYADQSHFANECSALAGVPPSVLCKTAAPAAAMIGA